MLQVAQQHQLRTAAASATAPLGTAQLSILCALVAKRLALCSDGSFRADRGLWSFPFPMDLLA